MMTETQAAPEIGAEHYFEDPRRICEETISTEEQNLAHVHVMRRRLALAATMGDVKACEQAKILDRSEARILHRVNLARLALEQLQRSLQREGA